MPTAADFRMEMYRMMYEAMQEGKTTAEINSGELHTRVGDSPVQTIGCQFAVKSCVVLMHQTLAM